jgi:hypothetical protein
MGFAWLRFFFPGAGDVAGGAGAGVRGYNFGQSVHKYPPTPEEMRWFGSMLRMCEATVACQVVIVSVVQVGDAGKEELHLGSLANS